LQNYENIHNFFQTSHRLSVKSKPRWIRNTVLWKKATAAANGTTSVGLATLPSVFQIEQYKQAYALHLSALGTTAFLTEQQPISEE